MESLGLFARKNLGINKDRDKILVFFSYKKI